MQGERNRVQVINVKNNTAFGKDKCRYRNASLMIGMIVSTF